MIDANEQPTNCLPQKPQRYIASAFRMKSSWDVISLGLSMAASVFGMLTVCNRIRARVEEKLVNQYCLGR